MPDKDFQQKQAYSSTGAVILVRPFVIFDVEGMQVSHYAKNVAPIVTLHPVDSRHYVIMSQNLQIQYCKITRYIFHLEMWTLLIQLFLKLDIIVTLYNSYTACYRSIHQRPCKGTRTTKFNNLYKRGVFQSKEHLLNLLRSCFVFLQSVMKRVFSYFNPLLQHIQWAKLIKIL